MAGTLFFTASDGTTYGIYKSDGTDAGTARLAAVSSHHGHLTAVGGKLFFTNFDGGQARY